MKRLLIVSALSLALPLPGVASAQDLSAAAPAPAATLPPTAASAAAAAVAAAPERMPQMPTPRRARATAWEALKTGLIGGALGGLVSAGLNYYVLPVPGSTADNAIGHGMTGFFCGLASGVIGVLIYARHSQPASPD